MNERRGACDTEVGDAADTRLVTQHTPAARVPVANEGGVANARVRGRARGVGVAQGIAYGLACAVHQPVARGTHALVELACRGRQADLVGRAAACTAGIDTPVKK
jgi:hypothetical protein